LSLLSVYVPTQQYYSSGSNNKLCGRPSQYAPAPCKLTFDLLILKVVSESRVTLATSMPMLVFLRISVLDLGPMYATDRQTSDAHHRLMPPPYGRGIITSWRTLEAYIRLSGFKMLELASKANEGAQSVISVPILEAYSKNADVVEYTNSLLSCRASSFCM